MEAWTDYPLFENEAGTLAPIRKVVPISYDQDKYVLVRFNGEEFIFKAGYLYAEPGRSGEVPIFPANTLPKMEH